jgi:hypothetical protein
MPTYAKRYRYVLMMRNKSSEESNLRNSNTPQEGRRDEPGSREVCLREGSPHAVLPGGLNSGQKAQKGPWKKKIWPEEHVAEFTKTGRKGAEKNFENKFLILLW